MEENKIATPRWFRETFIHDVFLYIGAGKCNFSAQC